MMITKKAINDDIAFIVATLKHKEVTIPSFFSCAGPGIIVLLGIVIWQIYVAFPILHHNSMARTDAYGSVGGTLFLGFMIFITLTSMRGKYLSMPVEIRKNSLIVRLTKHKAMFYVGLWVVINIVGGVCIKMSALSPVISCAVQLVALVFIWFIALVDLGRYDLAVFSSVIKAWRDGDKLDPEQLKWLDI